MMAEKPDEVLDTLFLCLEPERTGRILRAPDLGPLFAFTSLLIAVPWLVRRVQRAQPDARTLAELEQGQTQADIVILRHRHGTDRARRGCCRRALRCSRNGAGHTRAWIPWCRNKHLSADRVTCCISVSPRSTFRCRSVSGVSIPDAVAASKMSLANAWV